MQTEKFQAAIRLFDQANRQDPNKETYQGKIYPKELLYADRMSVSLHKFSENPSEALQLAVRCQHICRWEIPRSNYEMDRTGYLLWRQELKKFHAEKASKILKAVGYDDEMVDKVAFLLQKKQLKRNVETQLLEDVICLVFLEFYFEEFSEKYPEEKLVDILQKTWKKMSEAGQESALSLPLSENSLHLVKKALDI